MIKKNYVLALMLLVLPSFTVPAWELVDEKCINGLDIKEFAPVDDESFYVQTHLGSYYLHLTSCPEMFEDSVEFSVRNVRFGAICTNDNLIVTDSTNGATLALCKIMDITVKDIEILELQLTQKRK